MFNELRIRLVTWWRHGRFRNDKVRKKAFEDPYTTTGANGTLAAIAEKRKKLLDAELSKPEPEIGSVEETRDDPSPLVHTNQHVKTPARKNFVSDMFTTVKGDFNWFGKSKIVKQKLEMSKANREKYKRFEELAYGGKK